MSKTEKSNLVLDLDNTIICSVTLNELSKMKYKHEEITYKDMKTYYRIFARPYLQQFLDYAFENFEVSVWTAADCDYALFIIDNFILAKPDRKLKMIFHRKNCMQSQEIYENEALKDLRYLYNFPGYNFSNTILLDDNKEVYEANKKQTIPADYYNIKKKSAADDRFLLEAIEILDRKKMNQVLK